MIGVHLEGPRDSRRPTVEAGSEIAIDCMSWKPGGGDPHAIFG
jgi:hypothetical protein